MSLQTFLLRLLALLPILALTGGVTAWAAGRLGEATPRHDGRLTLNPLAHLDWLGALAFVVTGLGWMRPIALGYRQIRGGLAGVLTVIFAGEAALIALAWAATLLLPHAAGSASFSAAPVLTGGLVALAWGAAGFAILSLVPLPPLLAGHLVLAVPRWQRAFGRVALAVGVAWLALLLAGWPTRWLAPLIEAVLGLLSDHAPILLRGH